MAFKFGGTINNGATADVLSADGSQVLSPGQVLVSLAQFKGIELAANKAVLEDGDSVPVEEGDGTPIGNGVLHIAGNAQTHFTYDGGGSGTTLDNGESVNIDSADGSTILETGTASVVGGNLVGVLTPATSAVAKDAQTYPVTNSKGDARGNVTASVAANVLTAALELATSDIIDDGGARVLFDAVGTLNEPLGTGTALVSGSEFLGLKVDVDHAVTADAATIPLENDTGSARGNVNASVAANVLTAKLPTQADVVTDAQAKPVLDATGVNTLGTATAKVPISVFDGLQLDAQYAVTEDAGAVTLEDSGGNSLADGTAAVAANALTVTVPDSALNQGPENNDLFPVWSNDGSVQKLGNYDTDGPKVVLGNGDSLVSSGDPINIQNSAGSITQAGTLSVNAGGVVQHAALPADWAMKQNGGVVTVQNQDGSVSGDADITVTVGELNFASFNGDITAVKDSTSGDITNSDGSGTLPGVIVVTGGMFVQTQLANPTDALVSDGFTCPATGAGSTATIHVSAGGTISVTLN